MSKDVSVYVIVFPQKKIILADRSFHNVSRQVLGFFDGCVTFTYRCGTNERKIPPTPKKSLNVNLYRLGMKPHGTLNFRQNNKVLSK